MQPLVENNTEKVPPSHSRHSNWFVMLICFSRSRLNRLEVGKNGIYENARRAHADVLRMCACAGESGKRKNQRRRHGSSGSPVANSAVVATNIDTGFERNAQSNERGEYEVPLLPVGTYKLAVAAAGFAKYEQTGIRVRLDAASQVNVALQIGSTGQTVT